MGLAEDSQKAGLARRPQVFDFVRHLVAKFQTDSNPTKAEIESGDDTTKTDRRMDG